MKLFLEDRQIETYKIVLIQGHQSRSLKKDKQLAKLEKEEERGEQRRIRKVTPRTIKLNKSCFKVF